MTVQLLNTETGEVRQWDYERPVTKRTLKTRVARYIAWDLIDCVNDYRNHFLLIPPQELVPGEILDMLTVFVKYSPVIAIPNDSGGGYFFIQGNRRMKIFSLQNGKFVSKEDADLQMPYTLMSVRSPNSDGFAYEAKEALESARAMWESKIMLTTSAYRNTIREKSDNLSATDDEILAEAYVRLRLLNLSQDYHSLFHGRVPNSEQKKYGNWKLSSPSESEKLVSQIKEIEKEYDIFVFYYIYIPEEYNAKELCMLYVGRDMNGWESARERTAAGSPDACLKNAGSGERPDFGSAKIKALNNMAFRMI